MFREIVIATFRISAKTLQLLRPRKFFSVKVADDFSQRWFGLCFSVRFLLVEGEVGFAGFPSLGDLNDHAGEPLAHDPLTQARIGQAIIREMIRAHTYRPARYRE